MSAVLIAPEVSTPVAKSRKMILAQNGHSYPEQDVYLFLCGKKHTAFPPQIVAGGYNRIGRKLHLADKTVKRILRSLKNKLSIEPIPGSYDSKTQEPTKYRVYCYADILLRRSAVGLNGFIRNRGGVTLTRLPIAATTPMTEPSPQPAEERSSDSPEAAGWNSKDFRKSQLRTYLTQKFKNPTPPDDEVLNPLAQLIANESLFEQFKEASKGFVPEKGWKGFLTIARRCSEHREDYDKAAAAAANGQHQAGSKPDPSEEYAKRVREREKNRGR